MPTKSIHPSFAFMNGIIVASGSGSSKRMWETEINKLPWFDETKVDFSGTETKCEAQRWRDASRRQVMEQQQHLEATGWAEMVKE